MIRLMDRNRAEVEVIRQSACANNCAQCSSSCHEAVKMLVVAENSAKAAVGDPVELYTPTGRVLGTAVLVYLVPILLFLTAVLITSALKMASGLCALFSVLAFMAGVLLVVLYHRKTAARRQFTYKIVKIRK